MSRLLTRLAAAADRPRVQVANNCNWPTNRNTSAQWVQNCWTTHVAGPAGYSQLDLWFVNASLSTNAEVAGAYDFYLRAAVYYNGQFYQAKAGDLTQVFVDKNFGLVRFRVNVNIPPGAKFVVTNQRVAADLGAAGSYSVLTSTSGTLFRQDGILSGTDPNQDYTLGVGVPFGAKAGAVTVSGGAATAVAVAAAKAANSPNYPNGGLNLGYYYGPAGVGQPGALFPGTAAPSGGYGTASGGGLSSVYKGDTGGAGMSAANPPLAFVGGGGGFGSATTASYGPCLITGVPQAAARSVLLAGDSITTGYGSVDAAGDLNGSHGWYEQLLAGTCGVHKLAVAGESAAGFLSNKAQQLNFLDAAMATGLRPTHVVLALGVNDFLTNTNSDVVAAVQGYLQSLAQLFRARGAKVLGTTVPPAVKTLAASNRFSTVAEQEPFNANYANNGPVMQHNAAVASNALGFDGFVDGSTPARDSGTPHAFRVDAFGGTANAFCADDGNHPLGGGYRQGIHPNVGCGIPYLRATVPLPVFA